MKTISFLFFVLLTFPLTPGIAMKGHPEKTDNTSSKITVKGTREPKESIEISDVVKRVFGLPNDAKKSNEALKALNDISKVLKVEKRAPTDLEIFQIGNMYYVAEQLVSEKNREKALQFIEGHKKIIHQLCQKHKLIALSEVPKTLKMTPNQKYDPKEHFYVKQIPNQNLWVCLEYVASDEAKNWWLRRMSADAFVQFMPFANQLRKQEQAHFGKLDLIAYLDKSDGNSLFKEFNNQEPYPDHEGYESAMRGYKYHLENVNRWPVWVACVTSEQPKGPISKSRTKVTSPALKMMMTVVDGGPCYIPLGIHRSSIAFADDSKTKKKVSSGLSPFLQSTVAEFMGAINQECQYVVVRPLKSMLKVFEFIDVPQFLSRGGDFSETLPSIHWRPWHKHLQEVGSYTEKDIDFQDCEFALHDPRGNVLFLIPDGHNLKESPFTGDLDNVNRLSKNPFLIMYREDLAKLCNDRLK